MTPELDELLLDGVELGWDSELVEPLELDEVDVSELPVLVLPVVVVVAGVVVVAVLDVE